MRDGIRIALDVMLPPPERYDLAAGVPCVLAQTRVRISQQVMLQQYGTQKLGPQACCMLDL